MTYQFEPNGVGRRVRAFLDRVPPGSELIWITFCVSPGDPGTLEVVLKHLESRAARVRVVCQHPGTGEVSLSRSTFDLFHPASGARRPELLGFPAQAAPETEDGEDEAAGPLHAKVIVARCVLDGVPRYFALHGSFNFAGHSFNRNTEQVSEPLEVDETKWLELEDLCACSETLTVEHCTDAEQPGEDPAPIIDGPRTMRRRALEATDENAAPTVPPRAPELLRKVCEALDRSLRDYPGAHSRLRGFQFAHFVRLNSSQRRRNILYLPVGVGKSFIALRWLLQRLVEHADPTALVVLLVPNAWIQASLTADVEKVAHGAGVRADELLRYVRIMRYSQVLELRGQVVAAVAADEVHNWSSNGSRGLKATSSYTAALDWLTKSSPDVPQIGLSATPCRMEDHKFSVERFVRKFVGDATITRDEYDALSLAEAIEHGLLVPPEFQTLAPELSTMVREILHDAEGVPVKMGDYAEVVLRQVWEVLDRRRRAIINQIIEASRRHVRQRIVVYLPPVADASDKFVRSLCEAFQREYPGAGFWDFRSRSEQGGQAAFEEFRRFETNSIRPAMIVGIDRFCEGISVPSIDMLVMLRATLSPRVAVQALGRGLRLSAGKSKCLVLDAVLFKERLDQWDAVHDARMTQTQKPQEERPVGPHPVHGPVSTRTQIAPIGEALRITTQFLIGEQFADLVRNAGHTPPRTSGERRAAAIRLFHDGELSGADIAEPLDSEATKMIVEQLGLPRRKKVEDRRREIARALDAQLG